MPEINASLKKRMRKQGPKKVCGIERKRNQNGTQIGARNRQYFEKYRKKCIQSSIRKKVPNGTAKKQFECRPRGARVLISGRGGLRGVQFCDLILVPSGLLLI